MKKVLTILLIFASLTAWADTYHVKTGGNDLLDGLTDETAWATLAKVHATVFSPGDSILFRRGDTFRGSIYQEEDGTVTDRIVYGAYGTGVKPKILGAKSLSTTEDWVEESENLWKTSASLGTDQNDISNIVFNDETSWGVKRGSAATCVNQGDFWYNVTDHRLYIYSDGNPATFYSVIEACGAYSIGHGIFYFYQCSYITVQNLDFRYSCAAGIEFRTCDNWIVEYCNVSWVGGHLMDHGDFTSDRLGNGISLWITNTNVEIRYNTVSQCYDEGIAPQGQGTYTHEHINIHHNIIEKCWVSMSFWTRTGSTTNDVHFDNNTSIDPGMGWSDNQRPDLGQEAHFRNYLDTEPGTDLTLRNNIFYGGKTFGLYFWGQTGWTISNNVYYNVPTVCDYRTTMYTTLAQWQAASTYDDNSISLNPLFLSSTDFRLQPSSPAINTGVDVGFDYYSTAPDMGAFERWGVTYYIKDGGSDVAAGTSDATAWGTLSKVHSTTFSTGDSILFRRGDTFRGSIYQDEDGIPSNWIVYGAYGTGAKPKILGAKDLSSTDDWTNHAGNVWKTAATLGTAQNDISNLIFNDEASCGFKKKSIDSLNAQGKFWYNTTDDLVYMYSTSNPGTFYTHIEAAGHHDINQGLLKWINSSYVKVENLDIRYSSGAGIETQASDNITIEDCDLSWIGGEWLYSTGADLRRLGNGFSFVLNNDSITVRRCAISECYDAGISPQAWVDGSSMTNMWFYSNIITNCWYSYETWSALTYTLSNVHFFNNTCVDPGYAWSNSIHQRPDLNNASHVIMWALTGTASNVTIRNNIFSGYANYALRLDDNVNKLVVDYNLFDVDTVGYTAETTKYLTLAEWVAAMSQDVNSISGDPLFITSTNFNLQSTSPAIDAGLDVGLLEDYLKSALVGAPDLGALEYINTIIDIIHLGGPLYHVGKRVIITQ